jgi:hypothetical protein
MAYPLATRQTSPGDVYWRIRRTAVINGETPCGPENPQGSERFTRNLATPPACSLNRRDFFSSRCKSCLMHASTRSPVSASSRCTRRLVAPIGAGTRAFSPTARQRLFGRQRGAPHRTIAGACAQPERPARPVLYVHARARDETDEEALVDQIASRRPRGEPLVLTRPHDLDGLSGHSFCGSPDAVLRLFRPSAVRNARP